MQMFETWISAAAAAAVVGVIDVIVGLEITVYVSKVCYFSRVMVVPLTASLNNKYRTIGGLDPDVLNMHNHYR